MRITSVVALVSTVFLMGCQSPDGSVDWHRTAAAASRVAMAGGGFLVGGPAGATAGFTLGSGLFGEAEKKSSLFDFLDTRSARPTAPRRLAKGQMLARPSTKAANAAPAPRKPETEAPPPEVPAKTQAGHETADVLAI
jgi:hypothetical protein